METKSFTLDYFGKPVAAQRDGDIFTVQISYIPLRLQKTNQDGTMRWIDLEQKRATSLSEDVGRLIDQFFLLQ